MFRGFAQRSGESTPRDSGLKLRHQAIAFVSAGTNTPVEKKEETLEEADIVAALIEEDDDDDHLEDEAMEDTMVDEHVNSALDNTLVTDTDVEISRDTKAMHIHENVTAPIVALDGAMDTLLDVAQASSSKPPTPPQEETTLSFVIDTEGDPSLSRSRHSNAKVPVRPASPTPSDSSEEVILFHGRNRPTVVDDPMTSSRNSSARRQPPQVPKPSRPAQQAPPKVATAQAQANEGHMTDALLAALGQAVPKGAQASGWAAKAPTWNQQQQTAPTDFTPAPPGSWWKNKGMPNPDLGPSPEEKMAFDAAAPKVSKVAFAFTAERNTVGVEKIATAKAEWDQALREKKRNKKAAQELDDEFETVDEDEPSSNAAPKVVNRAVAHDLGAKTNRRGKRGRKRSNKLLRDLQTDQTDEDEAAYNDYMENLKAQLEADDDMEIMGIRSAEGGPSLVVNGEAIDENDVLDRSTRDINYDELRMMDTDSDDSDDEELGLDIDDLEEDDDPSEFDSSDLESELAYNEKEQWEDEEDLRERRIAAMDDETLARLWAKQAELGISDDDLVIDDGTFVEDDLDEFGDVDEAKAGLDALKNSSFARSTTKRSSKKSGGMNFPNATAFADTLDQYGDAGFDIMDFDRPSLRPKRGGRKGKLPPELEALSDDELKDEMLGHWSNDREKKRLKKAEREELRREGLLGAGVAKKGKADLSQKYLQGMTVVQIHDELRIFLQDVTKTTRAFPPMDKHDRKSLHEIANALNLKSKSVGAGKNRAPVLYKTNRTADYTDATFNRVTAAATRGFLSTLR